jgi:hypothetical protein
MNEIEKWIDGFPQKDIAAVAKEKFERSRRR